MEATLQQEYDEKGFCIARRAIDEGLAPYDGLVSAGLGAPYQVQPGTRIALRSRLELLQVGWCRRSRD